MGCGSDACNLSIFSETVCNRAMCFAPSRRLCSSRITARRSRRACAKSTRAFSISLINGDSRLLVPSLATLREQLSFRFQPIGLCVTGQCKSTSSLRDEVGSSRIASSDGSAFSAASFGFEAFPTVATFLALVSRGFRLAVARRARLPLPAFTLKEPPVSEGVSFLSWTIFFFFGTDFIVDDFNSFSVHRLVGKCFLALL